MNGKYFRYINLILDFYSNSELNLGFDNGLFKEGNAEERVFSRLERAAKDEASDGLLNSRYAIWASNTNDLIEVATRDIKRNDTDKALKQLYIASNVIKAYKDIKTILDNMEIYKVSDVFRAYSSHMLSLADSNSKLLTTKEIVKLLKERTKISRIRLPSDIEFSIKNGVLRVYINTPIQNMQANGAAFEGWILALKAWLSDIIIYVELDFALPSDLPVARYGNSQICHFNRFLYRINNLLRLFPEWFFLNQSKLSVVSGFMDWLKEESCLLNHSLRERESVIDTDKMERKIESWFAFEDGKELLCNLWKIDQKRLFNQLPVGVFYEEIKSKNAIFTRGAGAIDLWGISKDGETLHMIELKCGNNINIGVISETLFYTAVLYDTCVANDTIFSFGRYRNSSNTEDMKAIRKGGNKFKVLHSHILAERYHPLFSHEVVNLLRYGLANLDIEFNIAEYDYEKKIIK